MRLLCPNCAKELQVPDQFAGQTMKCPLCTGTFTVPTLPSMPGAVSMPTPPPPVMAPPPPTYAAPTPAAPPPPAYASAPAAPGQPQTLTINPRIIHWLAPVCLLGMFILLFFPWVGMFPGNVSVVTQNGWQAAFGMEPWKDQRWLSYSTQEKFWASYYGDDVQPLLEPGSSIYLIFFILLLILALPLAFLSTLVSSGVLKLNFPAALAGIWPYRSMILAGLTLGCLALLIATLWSDFPLESNAYNHVKAAIEATRQAASTPTAERSDTQRWDMELGIRLGGFALRTTAWLSLTVILNILAVLGALMQYRMDRSGSAALPTIQIKH